MPEVSGFAFWIHVTARAKRPLVGGMHGDALRVAVGALPIEGRANAACVVALAEAFQVPKRVVEIDPRSRHRRKRVHIDGSSEPLERRFRELAGAS